MARVVVIEDNQANRDLLSFLLTSAGHEVLLANEGKSGLALIQSHRPELVLMDIFMPEMDGYEAIRQIRADPNLSSGCRYVAVTALAMHGDREKLLAAGFDHYISKPIDAPAFLQDIARMLDEQAPQPQRDMHP